MLGLGCIIRGGALALTVVSEAPAAPAPAAVPAGKLPENVQAALSDVTLESDGGGRLRYRGDGFTAIIHPDGSFEFRDHGGSGEFNFFGLDLFRRRLREPEPERYEPYWTGVLEEAMFPQGRLPIMASFSARFGGLADGRRKDRHKSAKRYFLAATERLRMHLGAQAYKERLRRELADLGDHLVEIWHDTALPLVERRRQIFERWADCEDPTAPARSERDASRVAFATTARAKIEAFVRQVAPKGSPQAYSRAELERLNRGRTGNSRFRPYDAATPTYVLVEPEDVPIPEPPPLPPPVEPAPPAEPPRPEPPPSTTLPLPEPPSRAGPAPDVGRPVGPPERGRPARQGVKIPLCLFTRSC